MYKYLQLISGDLGGSIGLFVGASALSVFEILDVFIFGGIEVRSTENRARRKRKADDLQKNGRNQSDPDGTRAAMQYTL